MSLLFEVWTFGSVSLAIFGGFVGGLVLQSIHPETIERSIAVRAFLKSWLIAVMGALFFTGQAVGEWGGVPIEHVTSRFTLWLLFSVLIGVGAYVGLCIRARG